MKTTLKILTILFITLFIDGCGTRTPFTEKTISKENALVYIYVSDDIGENESISDSYYKIQINSKNLKQKIRMNEYLAFEMKPNNIKISVTRAAIEEKTITLDLKSGNIYYIRLDTNLDNDAFTLTQIDPKIASKEIQKTGLAGSVAINKNEIITEIIDSGKNETNNLSKSDEIKKAYKLKTDGILSEKEYSKLKAEILAK